MIARLDSQEFKFDQTTLLSLSFFCNSVTKHLKISQKFLYYLRNFSNARTLSSVSVVIIPAKNQNFKK